jgi:muramoyltetrapeptide carboxypeptidase
MTRSSRKLQKPKALRRGSRIGIVSPSSPADDAAVSSGITELTRLGFVVEGPAELRPQGYFAGSHKQRFEQFCKAILDKNIDGVIGARGGYGANYLLDFRLTQRLAAPKCLVGYSDVNVLQYFLAVERGWAGFYGPMVASGFHSGAQQPGGYDENSLLRALGETKHKWEIPLHGSAMRAGTATGHLVGGCLTMLQSTLGTRFTPDADDAILVLEDRGMKPYQVDRALRHLYQAGVFRNVNGIVLGDFPDCDSPMPGSPSVPEICAAVLGPLKVPIVFGAPIGHTKRAILTIPLGVRAKLHTRNEGTLEILEPAVIE